MLATQTTESTRLNSFTRSKGNLSVQRNITKQTDLLFDSHEEILLELIEWLERTGFITAVTCAHSRQEFVNSAILNFRLTEKYETNFAWVRGFFSLGDPFKIVTDRELRTFSFALNCRDITSFKIYFEKIVDMVKSEIEFRTELKQLIQLEAKYNRLQNMIKKSSKAFI